MPQKKSIATMEICLYTFDNKETARASRVVAQVPRVGEYFKLSSDDSSWFKVLLVVHTLETGETVKQKADIYAEKVERAEAIKASEYKGELI